MTARLTAESAKPLRHEDLFGFRVVFELFSSCFKPNSHVEHRIRCGPIAQSAERGVNGAKVVGSIPTGTTLEVFDAGCFAQFHGSIGRTRRLRRRGRRFDSDWDHF